MVYTVVLEATAERHGGSSPLLGTILEYKMQEYINTLNIIDEITSVDLFEAFISIEQNKADKLIEFLKNNNISASYAEWNHPRSLYVGEGEPTGKLAVISLKW